MRLVGHINVNGYFPSPLVTIAREEDGTHILFYPNGDSISVSSVDHETLKKVLIRDEVNSTIDSDRYAYAFSEQDIVFGLHSSIVKELKNRLIKSNMDDRFRLIIEEFVESNPETKSFKKSLENALEVPLAAVGKKYSLLIRLTTRSINLGNGSASTAKRLILQYRRNGATKTAYRKNLNYDQSENNLNVPTAMILPFCI